MGYQFMAPAPTRHSVRSAGGSGAGESGNAERAADQAAQRCPVRASAEEEAAQAQVLAVVRAGADRVKAAVLDQALREVRAVKVGMLPTLWAAAEMPRQ